MACVRACVRQGPFHPNLNSKCVRIRVRVKVRRPNLIQLAFRSKCVKGMQDFKQNECSTTLGAS